MEPSHLLRWGHPVTVGMAQCDRCSCRPAQQANKTIPLICHLIPLSTGLQSQSMHNMLTIYRHLETLGLEKKSLCLWAHGLLLKSQQTMLKWLPFKVAGKFVILNVDVLVFFLLDIMFITKPTISQVYELFWSTFIVFIGSIQCCIPFCLKEILLTWKI